MKKFQIKKENQKIAGKLEIIDVIFEFIENGDL
jgi:hypothetical protein